MTQPLRGTDGEPVGLRERKKMKTRQAIQEHALRLFRELGYDGTTVVQIAEAAEVSPSTFFRYFPTKEDVVLFDALDPMVIDSFRRQPPDLSPIQALRGALHETFGALTAEQVGEQLERGHLIFGVPDLQAVWVAETVRTSRLMAGLFAERVGRAPDDLQILVYTGAVLGAMMAAMIPVVQNPDADFMWSLDSALDFLEEGLQISPGRRCCRRRRVA